RVGRPRARGSSRGIPRPCRPVWPSPCPRGSRDATVLSASTSPREIEGASRCRAGRRAVQSDPRAEAGEVVTRDRADPRIRAHGAPTLRRLQPGDPGNVEFGAAYKRYTKTIGRQFNLGPPSQRVRDLYAVARAAFDACLAEIRDGVPALVPHEAAKRVIAEAGMDGYRLHTTGYSIGAGVPPSWGEPLNMFGGSKDVLRAGMVVSIELPVFAAEE